jgi:hypothetical protein
MVFWFSYLSPYEGGGVISRMKWFRGLFTGRPPLGVSPFGFTDKLLPAQSEDFNLCVRHLVKQPVVWCGYTTEGFLLGPAERWISWESLQEISGDPKCVLRPCGILGRETAPLFLSQCPKWSVALDWWLGYQQVLPNSVIDPLPSSPPLPGSYSELCHWVHSNDDKFGFRLGGAGYGYKVYLYPNQMDGDLVESHEEISATSPTTGVCAPSAGLVATLAGGALGLGYSVTKLVS